MGIPVAPPGTPPGDSAREHCARRCCSTRYFAPLAHMAKHRASGNTTAWHAQDILSPPIWHCGVARAALLQPRSATVRRFYYRLPGAHLSLCTPVLAHRSRCSIRRDNTLCVRAFGLLVSLLPPASYRTHCRLRFNTRGWLPHAANIVWFAFQTVGIPHAAFHAHTHHALHTRPTCTAAAILLTFALWHIRCWTTVLSAFSHPPPLPAYHAHCYTHTHTHLQAPAAAPHVPAFPLPFPTTHTLQHHTLWRHLLPGLPHTTTLCASFTSQLALCYTTRTPPPRCPATDFAPAIPLPSTRLPIAYTHAHHARLPFTHFADACLTLPTPHTLPGLGHGH